MWDNKKNFNVGFTNFRLAIGYFAVILVGFTYAMILKGANYYTFLYFLKIILYHIKLSRRYKRVEKVVHVEFVYKLSVSFQLNLAPVLNSL